MPEDPRRLTRADLPAELTAETIRTLPLGTLRRLSRPGNGVLSPQEQKEFDAVLHEVMSQAATRVAGQMNRPEWAQVRREAGAREARRGRGGSSSRVEEQLSRLARRIDQQVGAAESLAPGVDWSFAQGGQPVEVTDPIVASGVDTDTVSDLEQRLSEQVELVQVMSEIADVSKRTYALEQQRDLQNTRTVFFGFVVSVAVLVAGWAPIVAAHDWAERVWILLLTLGTCAVAGVVYALIRSRQNARQAETDDEPD